MKCGVLLKTLTFANLILDRTMPKNVDARRGKTYSVIIARRRREVCSLYCEGWTLNEIGEKLNTTGATISNDLKAIRKDWLAYSTRDFGQAKAEELAKIDHLEMVAYEAWKKSCENAEERKHKREKAPRIKMDERGKPIPGSTRLLVIKETLEDIKRGQTGNPAFLDKIAWCIQTRAKILGLLDERNVTNVNHVSVNWDELYRQQSEEPVPDVIEGVIEQAKTLPSKDSLSATPTENDGKLPYGLKELPNHTNGEPLKGVQSPPEE